MVVVILSCCRGCIGAFSQSWVVRFMALQVTLIDLVEGNQVEGVSASLDLFIYLVRTCLLVNEWVPVVSRARGALLLSVLNLFQVSFYLEYKRER